MDKLKGVTMNIYTEADRFLTLKFKIRQRFSKLHQRAGRKICWEKLNGVQREMTMKVISPVCYF